MIDENYFHMATRNLFFSFSFSSCTLEIDSRHHSRDISGDAVNELDLRDQGEHRAVVDVSTSI